jgi:alpha-amylase
MSTVYFALALHNHQPIGNFDGVINDATSDSYLPFLEVLEQYPNIPISLHISGCLMEWAVAHRPEYVESIARFVERGQIELIGGAYYEPILPAIPRHDRIGQIQGYAEFLRETFRVNVRGIWIAERVWEQSLASDLAEAGVEYTILDDHHFRKAGLSQEQLFGYYLCEDQGRLVRVFPGSEPMRYLIPFQPVEKVIEYLKNVSDRYANALVVFADDGEKFGTWPGTKKHVYQDGWLTRLFDALQANRDWIELCTLSSAMDRFEPLGRIYLPDCSYREMTEWVLPPDRLLTYERLWHELDDKPDGTLIKEFLRGGYWRNFFAKYPEANDMYSRMLQVSRRVEELCDERPEAFGNAQVYAARRDLYRGQCNCAYWHGAFGGLYLPHLRNAVYSRLIEADNRLTAFERGAEPFVCAQSDDWNLDGQQEVRLDTDRLIAFIRPQVGGHIYELDVRDIAVNLAASLSRRPEAYHEKVRRAGETRREDVSSIHDRVVFKQQRLDRWLTYDTVPRKMLVDHFYSDDAKLSDILAGSAADLGDFAAGRFAATVEEAPDHAAVRLTREGGLEGNRMLVTKRISARPATSRLVVEYRLERLPANQSVRFAVELNFAALAAGADDRYYHLPGGARLGRLGATLDLHGTTRVGLVDEWLGIDVLLGWTVPGGVWTMPIQSVSQSEGGFELVHQSACVMLNWYIPSGTNCWEVELELTFDTQMAAARKSAPAGT